MHDLPPPIDPSDRWWEEPSVMEPAPLQTDAAATYEYRNADGSIAFVVARWEAHNGHKKKSFAPFCWDGEQWVKKQLVAAGERPLWNLKTILDNPSQPVLVVEGEKTAAAAMTKCPGFIVTTWAGGSSAVATADWAPLKDRDVVIWPDNDEPGRKAAAAIQTYIPSAHTVTVPLDIPEAWDLADDLPASYGEDWIQAKLWATAAGGDGVMPPKPEPKPDVEAPSLITYPVSWQGKPILPREWLVDDYIPMHVPTMISGKGGSGKSLLGVQMTHAARTNLTWLGKPIRQCKVLAVFSEDDEPELMRRYNAVCVNTNTEFGDLDGLALIIRDGDQTPLMDYPNPHEAGKPSSNFEMIYNACKAHGAQLILLDSLYNFFSGNENNRVHVAQFVYLLRKLAKDCNAAVVFIAHPSKAGISTGDGYAGSTAWHDAVRARLFLTEEEDDGEKRLVLKTMKANYGPKDGEVEVYYQAGMLWPRSTQTEAPYREASAEAAFLKCLRTARSTGRNVSDSRNAGAYMWKVFSPLPDSRGFTRQEFEAAMERLFLNHRIEVRTDYDNYRNKLRGIYEANAKHVSNENDGETE